MTTLLHRENAYLREAHATVIGIHAQGGIILDETVFYATGGGQPGDAGEFVLDDGRHIAIGTTVYDPADKTTVLHLPLPDQVTPALGQKLIARVNWDVRLKRMRVHTALHLLSCALPFPVTGGSIGDGEGRLDFDIPDARLDKAEIAGRLAELIGQNADVTTRWITDAELDANPGLVKTMTVKPPRGSGRVRLVDISGIDLQPCGGTHVKNTREIGMVSITDIQNKGKQNRRVRIALS